MDGKTIKRKIKQKGLTLRQTATNLGITEQALNGRLTAKSISCETLEMVAKAIGESVSYFYNEKPIFSIEDADKFREFGEKIRTIEKMIRDGRLIVTTPDPKTKREI